MMMGILLKERLDAVKVECGLVTKSPTSDRLSDRVSTGSDKSELEFILRHFGMNPKK